MLDPQIRALLEQAREAGAPDFADLPPAVAREMYSQILAATDLPVPAEVALSERTMAGPGGELILRCYRPAKAEVRGAVLYLHGGGFVVGTPSDYDGVAGTIAALSGCLVVQVDYRLAPEHPFPAAVEDSYAALVWLREQATELGIDPARIAIAGDSAGANLSAVCALLARDRGGPALALQCLIYPATANGQVQYDSYRRFGAGYTLTSRAMSYFMGHYLTGSDAPADMRMAPLSAPDLSGLPPALVQVAGYDPLRDEGIAYAEAMAAAGTSVTLVEYASLAHGYISMAGISAGARLALEQVATALLRAVA
ncbi:lipase [Marinobacterium zhoushanense]|uniref:Lipase n=1 Tax=Marinobacterium zhoushanense TaxID=1679163 RepID=A0ABQ1KJ88_9GAMM|nr:alpha/beta hydrolase [Marinobacterium zhoushanense]GGB98505.1 lipase [Marinobacterium zhoushanense]